MPDINAVSHDQLTVEIQERASCLARHLRDVLGWDVLAGKEQLTLEDVRALPVWRSAITLLDLAKTRTTDGDPFDTDHPANLDYFDALLSDNRLSCKAGDSLRAVLDWVNSISEWEESDHLTVKAAATLAGITEASMRNALSAGALKATRNSDGRVVIARKHFLVWAQGRRNSRLPSKHTPDMPGFSGDDLARRPDRTSLENLLGSSGWRLHPLCDPETKRMLSWVHPDRKLCIGHEPDRTTTQNLWVRKDQLPTDGAWKQIPHAQYPASKAVIAPGKDYGRHSGLKKYPELALEALVLFKPRSLGEIVLLLREMTSTQRPGQERDAAS